jgi:hypothetical protein
MGELFSILDERNRAKALAMVGTLSDATALAMCRANDRNGEWDECTGSDARRVIWEWYCEDAPANRHECDEECDVDPTTDTCRVCGVHHGSPCPVCGGRGFHVDGCTNDN